MFHFYWGSFTLWTPQCIFLRVPDPPTPPPPGNRRACYGLFRPSWNDRRSRRLFLCFYSAIFQRTSAKFHTFAYNSKTVGSSCMKFWQQFEINELYVCIKFWGNRSRDFGFRTRKPPRKFGVKSGLSQKRLKYGKKYFIRLYILRYPFIPTNPLLAAMRFISFFSCFFLPNFCTLFFS